MVSKSRIRPRVHPPSARGAFFFNLPTERTPSISPFVFAAPPVKNYRISYKRRLHDGFVLCRIAPMFPRLLWSRRVSPRDTPSFTGRFFIRRPYLYPAALPPPFPIHSPEPRDSVVRKDLAPAWTASLHPSEVLLPSPAGGDSHHNIDALAKTQRMLSKNFVLQGLVAFQGRRHTIRHVEVLENRRNAVGRTFCDRRHWQKKSDSDRVELK